MLVPDMFRRAIDVHDTVIREQRQLVARNIWRRLPIVLRKAGSAPILCLLVLLDKLWAGHVFEFTHERQCFTHGSQEQGQFTVGLWAHDSGP